MVSDGNIFVLGRVRDNLQETFNLCLVVQRQTERFCTKKQPLNLISSSPCSKETNRIFCSHNYLLNSYYCRFWSWIIPLYEMFNEFIIINKNIQQCKQNSLLILHTSTKLHIAKTDNSTKFTKLTHTNNKDTTLCKDHSECNVWFYE